MSLSGWFPSRHVKKRGLKSVGPQVPCGCRSPRVVTVGHTTTEGIVFDFRISDLATRQRNKQMFGRLQNPPGRSPSETTMEASFGWTYSCHGIDSPTLPEASRPTLLTPGFT